MAEFINIFNTVLSINFPIPISTSKIMYVSLFGVIITFMTISFVITIIHALFSNSATTGGTKE